MSVESDPPKPPFPPARRARRSPGDRLRDAVMGMAGDGASLARHVERSWASITFAGTRHTLDLVFTGEAIADGENFIAELPEHEFTLAGQLVADAIVSAADHAMLPHPRLSVTCELLLLEEG